MLKARDMRRRINSELRGRSEAEQIRVLEGYIRQWPTNLRGEYVEIRRHLVRRLDRLQTSSRVRASIGVARDDPFILSKAGHLTAVLVGLPNAGKSHIFQGVGGVGATIADYPFSTAIPVVHLASLDNLSLQVVDLPPIAEGATANLPYAQKLRRILALADVLCVVLDMSGDIELQEMLLSEEMGSLGIDLRAASLLALVNRAVEETASVASLPGTLLNGRRMSLRSEDDFERVLPEIAKAGGYISVLAKPPGQSPEEADRLWVERGAAVQDLAAAVHRDLARRLTGARVWGESARQPGQTVSTEHRLSDGDIVELLSR